MGLKGTILFDPRFSKSYTTLEAFFIMKSHHTSEAKNVVHFLSISPRV